MLTPMRLTDRTGGEVVIGASVPEGAGCGGS